MYMAIDETSKQSKHLFQAPFFCVRELECTCMCIRVSSGVCVSICTRECTFVYLCVPTLLYTGNVTKKSRRRQNKPGGYREDNEGRLVYGAADDDYCKTLKKMDVNE